MHVRKVARRRVVVLGATVLVAGCIETVDGLDGESTTRQGSTGEPANEGYSGDPVGGETLDPRPGDDRSPPSGCDDHLDARACLDAGCNWQSVYGVMMEADDTCESGPLWGLCYPDSLTQPCQPNALRCDDGRHAWVLPGPDNAMVIARSVTSCDLPQHFLPCPSVAAPDDLVAAAAAIGGDAPDATIVEVVAEACACACIAEPAAR